MEIKNRERKTTIDYKAIRKLSHCMDCVLYESDFSTYYPNRWADRTMADINRYLKCGGQNLIKEQFDNEELDFMVSVIEENLTEDDCDELINNKLPCKTCSSLEDCYHLANQKCDSQFAENINYGGYNTEEEFWENLLD